MELSHIIVKKAGENFKQVDENPFLFFELRGIDAGRFVDVTLANRVESMLANSDTL